MTKYKITYRNHQGVYTTIVIEAENRKELFVELSQQKINPIKIDVCGRGVKSSSSIFHAKVFYRIAFSLCGVVIIAIACLLFSPTVKENTVKHDPQGNKSLKIKYKTHKKTINNFEKKADIPSREVLSKQQVGEIRDGKILLPSGRLHTIRGEVTNSYHRSKYAIFNHPSENVIVGLLLAKPGEGLVGTPRYNGRFTENFLRSLSDPIIINDNDTPDIKELKISLIQIKEELKNAHERGENIEEIILAARAECQELARYKQQLNATIHEFLKKEDNITEQDVDDYIQAANEMLARKGIAPLKPSAIARIKLKMKERE